VPHEPTDFSDLHVLQELLESKIDAAREISDIRSQHNREIADLKTLHNREIMDERDRSYDRALKEAKDAAKEKFEAHNGIIALMQEQYRLTMPRETADSKFAAMTKEIGTLREFRSALGGKTGANTQTILWAFSAASLLIALVSLFSPHFFPPAH
jgi:hypothetical protein